ncbi:MAG: glycosyltransferase family 1 protein [Pseudomonadota bacterium]
MRTVYFDVENTLNVPFITGIQRVVRNFASVVLNPSFDDPELDFVPIIYDHHAANWRRLSAKEQNELVSSSPRKADFLSRVKRKLSRLVLRVKPLVINKLDETAIFFDIESSWHSRLSRNELLPDLQKQGVQIAKLHYDIIPILFPKTTHPNTLKVFSEHLFSHLLYADVFFCISHQTKQDLIDFCEEHAWRIPESRVIRLGTKIDALQCEPDDSEGRFHEQKNLGRYILTVGTLEPRKNHVLLLDAFNTISQKTNLNLVLVGKIGWQAEDILATIRSHPLFNQRVFYLGEVSDTRLQGLYENAWLNVIPSQYEGFGLPVTEALARGVPTVCSDAGALTEVGANHAKFFSVSSADDLAAQVLEVAQNKASYQTLLRAAEVFQPISWEQTVADIVDGLKG